MAETDFICSAGTIVSSVTGVVTSLNTMEIVSYQLTMECDVSQFKYMNGVSQWASATAGTKKWSGRITGAVPTGGIKVTDLTGFVSAKTTLAFAARYMLNGSAITAATYTGIAVINSASLKFTSKDVSLVDIGVVGDGEIAES